MLYPSLCAAGGHDLQDYEGEYKNKLGAEEFEHNYYNNHRGATLVNSDAAWPKRWGQGAEGWDVPHSRGDLACLPYTLVRATLHASPKGCHMALWCP